MITLAEFRTIVAVVESGGIQRAADRLGRTPSAVSMTLKQLADRIGAPLFEGRRKSGLTATGRLVLEEARDLLAHYDRSCTAIQAFAGNNLGVCNVASVPSVAIAFLPEVLLRLRRDRPFFAIQIREADSRSVADAVAAGVVEFGFASLPTAALGLALTPILRDRLDIVCRAGDALTRRKRPLAWRDIGERTFLVNESYGTLSDPEFRAIEQASPIRVRNVGSLFAMVRADVGVTVLPRLSRSQGEHGLRFMPVADQGAFRVLGILRKAGRDLMPAARRFVACVLEIVAERSTALGYDAAPAHAAWTQLKLR